MSGHPEEDPADRRTFRLADAAWTDFNDLLHRPARRLPSLAKLLSEPAPWE